MPIHHHLLFGSAKNLGSCVRGDRVAFARGPLGPLPDLLEKVDRAFSLGIYSSAIASEYQSGWPGKVRHSRRGTLIMSLDKKRFLD